MDKSKHFVFVSKLSLEWTNLPFPPLVSPGFPQWRRGPEAIGPCPYDHGDYSSSLCPAFAPSFTLNQLKVLLAADPGSCCAVTAEFAPSALPVSCMAGWHCSPCPIPKARPWSSKSYLFTVCNLEGFQVADASLLQIFIFPAGTLNFTSSLRCLRAVHPRSVMDDLFSLVKSSAKGTFCTSKRGFGGIFFKYKDY